MEQRTRTLDHPASVVVTHAERAQPFLVDTGRLPFLIDRERVRIDVVGNYSTRRPERQLAIELR